MDRLVIGFPGSIEQTISGTTAMDHTHGWQRVPTDPRLLFIRGFALPSVGSFKSGTRGCLQADASSVALQPAGLTPRSNQTDDRRMTFTARRSTTPRSLGMHSMPYASFDTPKIGVAGLLTNRLVRQRGSDAGIQRHGVVARVEPDGLHRPQQPLLHLGDRGLVCRIVDQIG
ncbi:hypothetical protein Enr13x_36510 [Stieleria neptunia]|uniref:Uncharacterized protein n=1 Tax=Stieleria neptunia TaxID=2527979 RepID=A0A518HSH4_9BACT|nr:hypothetical protein Enr13x_36510 [Stieleria neptunia]